MSFELGKWLVTCDRCGFRRKAPDEVTKTWDNFIVCAPHIKDCFETRHPQEFVRSRPDIQTVPYTRPEPAMLDQSPAFNCAAATLRVYSASDFQFPLTVAKGTVNGPVPIMDEVTILCELTIT